jgi:hypothetical protein
MHSGPVATSARTCNSGNPAKPLESLGQGDDIQPFAFPCYEEIRSLNFLSRSKLRIPSHYLVQIWTDRDAPHSIKPASANREHIFL